MADTKTSGLGAAADVAPDDLFMAVDVSDTTMAPTGTNKKATRSLLQSYAAGTLTTDVKVQEHSATWNNAAVTFTGWDLNVTNTASAAGSAVQSLRVGGTVVNSVLPAGDLRIQFPSNSTGRRAYVFEGAATEVRFRRYSDNFGAATTTIWKVNNAVTTDTLHVDAGALNISGIICFNNGDTRITRPAAGVTGIRGAADSTGGALEFVEQTAPAAPSANGVRLYAQDNGGGKTQLMALFATGAAQQVAIEP